MTINNTVQVPRRNGQNGIFKIVFVSVYNDHSMKLKIVLNFSIDTGRSLMKKQTLNGSFSLEEHF